MRLTKFVTLLSLLGVLTACSQANHNHNQTAKKTEASQKILRVCSKDDPYSLDPRIGGDRPSQVFLRLMYEGLVREGHDGKPHLAAAKDIQVSEDGLTYTFYLRDSFWSNGEPVTAHDFEYAWKKVIAPDFPSVCGYIFYPIKNAKAAKENKASLDEVGIYAKDDKTLVVTLEHPAPYFVEMTTNSVFSPVCKAIAEKNPGGPLVEDTVTNGPFLLSKREPKNFLEFKPNDHYWDRESIKLDGIRFVIVPDDRTCLMLFNRGEVDWVGDPLTKLPLDAVPQLRKEKKLANFPSASIFLYVFNVDRAPFTSSKMRRAFGYAIDRHDIVDNILRAGEIPQTNFIPACMELHKDPVFTDHDLAKARQLFNEGLDELGISKEQLPKMVMSIPNFHLRLAQAIQQQWRIAFGLTVEIEVCEWNVYLDRLNSRDYQIGCYSWCPNFKDPMGNFHYLKYRADVINDTGWEHPQFVSLLEASDYELDLGKRRDYLMQAEELLLTEMPVVPVHTGAHSYLSNDHVVGVFASPLGEVDFKEADIIR